MLYDPKWEKQAETKVDPYALASLIAWMESHRPSEGYCFYETGECLIARYFAHALGFAVTTGYRTWGAGDKQGPIPDGWVSRIAEPEPHTFGAARARAAALASAKREGN